MSKLSELINDLCPNGVEYKKLGSFAECFSGATPRKKNPEYWEDGTIPWMSSGEVHQHVVRHVEGRITQLGYDSCSTRMVPAGTVLVALAGQGKTRGTVAITEIELCTNQSIGAILCSDMVDNKYLYYYLSGQYDYLRRVSSGEGTRGGLNMPLLRGLVIPVPPIEVQREIVRILDSFQELDDVLTAEIEAREKQLRSVLTFLDVNSTNANQTKPFKDCCKIGRGTYITKKDVQEGDIPVVMGGLEPAYFHSEFNHDGEAIVISRSGVNAGFSSFWNQPIFVSDGFVADGNGTDVLKYVYYALHARQRNVDMLRRGSGVPHVNGKMLGELPLFMPSVKEQSDWAMKCDAIYDLTTALRSERDARRKQFAYYRDKLLKFPEKVTA